YKLQIKKVVNKTSTFGGYTDSPIMKKQMIQSNKFFVHWSKDKEWVQVKLKKKDLLNLFESHQSEIKEYVSENKLNLKKEPDFVQVLKHFDSLL
ncbi:hypothetical protein, partial [Xanthovirga aplysinae]|uniref:hypothetical protein n=1 Tax=Xanthovirga aplysinae TaxID=2529853 RepID=UPI001CA3DD1F